MILLVSHTDGAIRRRYCIGVDVAGMSKDCVVAVVLVPKLSRTSLSRGLPEVLAQSPYAATVASGELMELLTLRSATTFPNDDMTSDRNRAA